MGNKEQNKQIITLMRNQETFILMSKKTRTSKSIRANEDEEQISFQSIYLAMKWTTLSLEKNCTDWKRKKRLLSLILFQITNICT
jgi:hypothetical protein